MMYDYDYSQQNMMNLSGVRILILTVNPSCAIIVLSANPCTPRAVLTCLLGLDLAQFQDAGTAFAWCMHACTSATQHYILLQCLDRFMVHVNIPSQTKTDCHC